MKLPEYLLAQVKGEGSKNWKKKENLSWHESKSTWESHRWYERASFFMRLESCWQHQRDLCRSRVHGGPAFYELRD